MPYSGAEDDVYLGTYNIYAANITDIENELDDKASLVHTHAASGITSGEFEDARISQSSVVQHQSALAISTGQISDLDLTAYVPYSGATGLVDLGSENLTTDGSLSSASLILDDNYTIEWDGSDAVHTISAGDFVFVGGNIIGTKSRTTKTADYIATSNDEIILCNSSSGEITITLPTSIDGKSYVIKKIDSSGNGVIVSANGAETIDGSSTQDIYDQYTSLHIIGDGSNWYII